MENEPTLTIVEGYKPGALGRLIEMHGVYYASAWDFGQFFESKVALESAAFFQRFNPDTDMTWLVCDGERIVGSLIIDGEGFSTADKVAHLRWFILDDECRGHGLGDQLMHHAINFCDERGFKRCYLTTFAGLDAARALYERYRFNLIEEVRSETWGINVTEQRFERMASCAH